MSLLCIISGIAWVLLLPLNEYSRQTYISENALLPGQVHTYFGGSEQNVFRAYKHELRTVLFPKLGIGSEAMGNASTTATEGERSAKLQELFKNGGLKTATQRYEYFSSGKKYAGQNVYGVLHAPRGDGTEAIVLTAALRNVDDALNVNGVTLLLSLARYCKRWSLWSKDIIFLITPDSSAGPQAWVDAYHSTHDPRRVQDLGLKSGALQGVVAIDYPFDHRFETLHVSYDGIDGQLPNLDLLNTAVSIASGQVGIGTSIQSQHTYGKPDQYHTYTTRLRTMARGMASQALGHATGPHSVFMPYHIDAITLSATGSGWQDEMAFGRTVESICRSLNNLLEKLHQSFFFYLLMQSNRFVSIGTYLPSAMAVAASYTIMAIYLWVLSGYEISEIKSNDKAKAANGSVPNEKGPVAVEDTSRNETVKASDKPASTKVAVVPNANLLFKPVDRKLTLPIAFLTALHLASLVPLYCLSIVNKKSLPQVFTLLSLASLLSPVILASALAEMPNNVNLPALNAPTEQQYVLIRGLGLLVLGLFLTVLATLNFSLSMFLGIVCTPLAFVSRQQAGRAWLAGLQYLALVFISPVGLATGLGAWAWYVTGNNNIAIDWLEKLAFGFNIWGSWGVVVGVFCVWWPAWMSAAVGVASSWFTPTITTSDSKDQKNGVVKGKRADAAGVEDREREKKSAGPKVTVARDRERDMLVPG